MKKLLFLFVVLSTSIGYASCGSDDDDSTGGGNSKNPLIGTWYEDHSEEWFIWKFDKNSVTCKTAWDSNMAGEPWNKGRNSFSYTWDSETQKGSFSYRYESDKSNSLVTTIYNFEYFEDKLFCEEIEDNDRPYKFKMIKSPDKVKVSYIHLSENTLSLWTGNTTDIKAYISPKNASYPSISWSSSDPKVAIVQNGRIKAVGAGSCVIIAESEKKEAKAECKVTVVTKDLLGTWHGKWDNYYYTINDDNTKYWSSEIDIRFDSNNNYYNTINGYGHVVIYYPNAPDDREYQDLEWKMNNDTVFFVYPEAPGLDGYLHSININSKTFIAKNEWNESIELSKKDSFDWSPYEGYFWYPGYHWFSNPNWSQTRSVVFDKPLIFENINSHKFN